MPTWDPRRYSRFEEARTRPARDLLARVPPGPVGTVIDVGCGPGNSTELLVERWPEARMIALDSSPEMLAEASHRLSDVRLVESDLRKWAPPTPVDVVFSNATLQWVDDHSSVLDHLLGWLAPGGALAIQMPANFNQPSHISLRRLVSGPRWRDRLAGTLRTNPVGTPQAYHRVLVGPDRQVDIWTTEYLHRLEGSDPVVEWMRGTGLRPVLDTLDPDEAVEFLAEYRRAVAGAYPPEPDGITLFSFRRLFITVVKE